MAPARLHSVRSCGDRGHRLGTGLSGLGTVAAALAHRETGDPFAGVRATRPSLRIGLCSSLSWGFLRGLIRRAVDDPAPPELTFMDGVPRKVLEAVERGEVDVAFVPGPREMGQLRQQPFWRERLFVLMPEAHPMARNSDVDLVALRDETFLVAGDSTERDLQAELLGQLMGGTAPMVQAMPVERSNLIDLVGLGFGLALTPGSALGAFHPGVTYRPIAGPVGASVRFHAAWLASNANPALDWILAEARALSAAQV